MAWYLALSLVVGAAIALKISMIENFQIVGRHMAALFPLFMITMMFWPKHSVSNNRERFGAIGALVTLGITWGTSDARLVFMDKYQKDSYREASSIAVATARLDGGKILWAADPHTAHYYGIQVLKDQHTVELGNDEGLNWIISNQAVDAQNWSLAEATAYLAACTAPAILVLSKPDLFDVRGTWHSLIEQRRPAEIAHLTTISIYEWRPETAIAAVSGFTPP
jgi:hypothetical protein